MKYLDDLRKRPPLRAWGCLPGILVILFFSTIGYAQTLPESAPPVRFNRILLLPVYDMRAIYGENFSLQGPLSGNVFSIDQVDPQAIDFVRRSIAAVLEQKGTFHLLPAPAQDVEDMTGIAPVAGSRASRLAAIQKAAVKVGADAALCTYVYAFRNRIGTAYGVERPTMVSFEMNLVSTATGRVEWRRDFTETQKTLNENLLQLGKFLQRKGRWITAEEMAVQAIEDILQTLP